MKKIYLFLAVALMGMGACEQLGEHGPNTIPDKLVDIQELIQSQNTPIDGEALMADLQSFTLAHRSTFVQTPGGKWRDYYADTYGILSLRLSILMFDEEGYHHINKCSEWKYKGKYYERRFVEYTYDPESCTIHTVGRQSGRNLEFKAVYYDGDRVIFEGLMHELDYCDHWTNAMVEFIIDKDLKQEVYDNFMTDEEVAEYKEYCDEQFRYYSGSPW